MAVLSFELNLVFIKIQLDIESSKLSGIIYICQLWNLCSVSMDLLNWKVVLFIVFLPVTNYSQSFHFEQFSLPEGLPHSQVNDILQGPDHRIYAATKKGLAVYNGNKFEIYTRKDHLDGNAIHLLVTDMQGRIWIASYNGGLNYFYQDSIYQVPEIKNNLGGKKIYEILQRSDSMLFFITSIDILAVDSDTCYSLLGQLEVPRTTGGGQWAALSGDSILYVGGYTGKFFKINLNTNKFSWGNFGQTLGEPILSMATGYNDDLFFSNNHGLIEFRDDTFYKNHVNVPGRCWKMNLDQNGILEMYSEGGGFGFFNSKNNSFKGYSKNVGLPSAILFGGAVDHESNIWLASANEGLLQYRDESTIFFDETNGIPRNSVTAIAHLADTLFIGTQKGLLLMVDDQIIDTLFRGKDIYSISQNKTHITLSADFEIFKIFPNLIIKNLKNIRGGFVADINNYLFTHSTEELRVKKQAFEDEIGIGWVKDIEELDSQFVLMLDYGIAMYNLDSTYFLTELSDVHFGAFTTMTTWRNSVLLKSDEHLHQIKFINEKLVINNIDISEIPMINQMNAMACDRHSLWLVGNNQYVRIQISDLLENGDLRYTLFPVSKSFFRLLLAIIAYISIRIKFIPVIRGDYIYSILVNTSETRKKPFWA